MNLGLRCAILSLAFSWTAGAATIITLVRDGVAVSNGEVCLFRAAEAENPFRRWLAPGEVTCVAPGWAMDFPSGQWNVFGRIDGKALSAPVLIDSNAAPSSLLLTLQEAATLAPVLPAGQRGLVVAPRRNSAYPVPAGTQRVTVPAGEELWLLTIEKSRAVSALFPIPAIEAHTERAVDARTGGLRAAVLGWVRIPPPDRAALRQVTGMSSPKVLLKAAGPAIESDPLPPPEWLSGSFVLVRGVSAGEADLRAEGHGWLPHSRPLTIADRPITVVDDPVLVRGASSLHVSWNSAENLADLDGSLGSCTSGHDAAALVEVAVSRCASPKPGESVDPTTCTPFRRETFVPQVPFGSFVVDDLAPGHYRAEVRLGRLPPIGAMAETEPFEQQRVAVRAYYSSFSGNLTRGGESLGNDARLKVAGVGVGFASRETGQYFAVFPDPMGTGLPEDARIDITTCDEESKVFVLTDRHIGRGARYDIDIPDNSVTIRVTDTFTRMGLPSATLRYSVMSDGRPRRAVVQEDRKSEGESEFILEAVPTRRDIVLKVRHPGYQEYIIEPFTMGKDEKKSIDAQLVPLRGSPGRILSALPFESGVILWMSAVGTETERAELAPDGTFVYSNTHAADETMAVVSLSHPLWVLRAPAAVHRQELQIRFPDTAPRRAFTVLLRGPDHRAGTFIGIVVGGLLVSQEALRIHQTTRELPFVARAARSLNIRDIAETGPIDVVLGPTVNEVPTRGRPFDPLLLPRANEPPKQRLLPGMTQVVFEVK